MAVREIFDKIYAIALGFWNPRDSFGCRRQPTRSEVGAAKTSAAGGLVGIVFGAAYGLTNGDVFHAAVFAAVGFVSGFGLGLYPAMSSSFYVVGVAVIIVALGSLLMSVLPGLILVGIGGLVLYVLLSIVFSLGSSIMSLLAKKRKV